MLDTLSVPVNHRLIHSSIQHQVRCRLHVDVCAAIHAQSSAIWGGIEHVQGVRLPVHQVKERRQSLGLSRSARFARTGSPYWMTVSASQMASCHSSCAAYLPYRRTRIAAHRNLRIHVVFAARCVLGPILLVQSRCEHGLGRPHDQIDLQQPSKQ